MKENQKFFLVKIFEGVEKGFIKWNLNPVGELKISATEHLDLINY